MEEEKKDLTLYVMYKGSAGNVRKEENSGRNKKFVHNTYSDTSIKLFACCKSILKFVNTHIEI